MKKYRKKPLIVEAVQWDGQKLDGLYPIYFFQQHQQGWHYSGKEKLAICTLEGEMIVEAGDYIVRGIKGEFYPVKKDLFYELYETVE